MGLDPDRFWKLTLPEVFREMRAAVKRSRREHNERMGHAWHVAALYRSQKMPKLKQLLISETHGQKPRRQTWQEMQAILGANAKPKVKK